MKLNLYNCYTAKILVKLNNLSTKKQFFYEQKKYLFQLKRLEKSSLVPECKVHVKYSIISKATVANFKICIMISYYKINIIKKLYILWYGKRDCYI